MINTTIIKKFVAVNKQFDTNNIAGNLLEAESYVKKVVSEALFEDYRTTWNTLGGNDATLLALMQEALVYLAFWDFGQNGQLEISDAGMHNVASKDRKLAWQWQIVEARNSMKFKGFKALEKCLAFLWSKNNGTFPLWDSSPEKTERLSLFINNSQQFQSYYNIHENACVYWYIRPKIRQVMEQSIKPIISSELYNELLAQIKGRNITNLNNLLLDVINRAVAYGAITYSVPELTALLTDAGIVEPYQAERTTQNASANARDSNMSLIVRNAQVQFDLALQAIRDYLYEYHDDYPLFEDSDLYQPERDKGTIINNENRGVVTFG